VWLLDGALRVERELWYGWNLDRASLVFRCPYFVKSVGGFDVFPPTFRYHQSAWCVMWAGKSIADESNYANFDYGLCRLQVTLKPACWSLCG
jgi:hypothetical protein